MSEINHSSYKPLGEFIRQNPPKGEKKGDPIPFKKILRIICGTLFVGYFLVPKVFSLFNTSWPYSKTAVKAKNLAKCISKTEKRRLYTFLNRFDVLKCSQSLTKYFLASEKCRFVRKQFQSILLSVHPDKLSGALARNASKYANKAYSFFEWIHQC